MAEPLFTAEISDPQTSKTTDYLITVRTNYSVYGEHGEPNGECPEVEEEEEDRGDGFEVLDDGEDGSGPKVAGERLIKCRKTYSNFVQLREDLQKLGVKGAAELPALPGKTLFGSSTSDKVVQQRLQAFQALFDKIALTPELSVAAPVVEFVYTVAKPNYDELREKLKGKALEVGTVPENEWVVKQDKGGCKVSVVKTEGSKLVMVRSQVELPLTVTKAMEIYRDSEAWPNWASEMSLRTIETVDPPTRSSVMNVSYRLPVVTNRDTCFYTTEFEGLPTDPSKEGARFIAACSISHPECPKRKGYTRAFLSVSVSSFAPIGDGSTCAFTSFVHTDPRGKIPSSAVNSTLGSANKQLTDMRDFMNKVAEKGGK